jgi:hypothetical protein
MKKLFLLFPVLILTLALLGCIEDSFRVYYHSDGATEGEPPSDSKLYKYGDSVTVQGSGTLKNDDYTFLGWSEEYSFVYHYPGKKLTMRWGDINLYPVWDDGLSTPFLFEVQGDEVTITSYNGTSRDIVIPDNLQGKTVTAIADLAFSNLSIYEITLPKQLKRIGIGAFANNDISKITIPNSVVSIGMGAFSDNSLTKVTLGTGLTLLETGTFSNNKLTDIVIPANINTINTGAFGGNNIKFINLGSDVDIESETAFGTYGALFATFYNAQGKISGLYYYNDADESWKR